MSAYYGNSTMGWDGGQAYDSMQATTNPYAGTYSTQQAPVLTAEKMRQTIESLRGTRERKIQEYIERTKMGLTEGEVMPYPEMRCSSSKRSLSNLAHEYVFRDDLTGLSYVITAYDQDRLKNQYYNVPKDLLANMDYKVRLPKGVWHGEAMKMKVAYDSDYNGPLCPPNMELFLWEECTSCKTRHKTEKLDLIGRCSVKLKSHNEKLRKLYWAHNKNKK